MVAVAVVGAGFWGSAVSRLLTERGIGHIVVDDAHPLGASRNAAGICKLSWYRQDTVAKMIDGVFTYDDFAIGFEWLRDQVIIDHVPETFVNMGRGTSRMHSDNYLADPAALLITDAVETEVTELRPHLGGVYVGDLFVDQVVVCAGARTDALLEASGLGRPTGVQPLLGRAIRFDCADFDKTPECMTVMTRPYVHYTFRHLNGQIRGGDTVERKRDDKRLADLYATAIARYTGVREITEFGGIRPVCKRMFVGRVHPRVIAATGGHRVGFGLAGAVARRVVELL
jgi:glycine/D-amino acid oxidase-like deaminating enzyme